VGDHSSMAQGVFVSDHMNRGESRRLATTTFVHNTSQLSSGAAALIGPMRGMSLFSSTGRHAGASPNLRRELLVAQIPPATPPGLLPFAS